jgi:biotin carboxyl carrier protein
LATRKYVIEGQSFEVEVVSRSVNGATVRVNGKRYQVAFPTQAVPSAPQSAVNATAGRKKQPAVNNAAGDIRAPMAGRILQVHGRVGDHCAAGTALIVLDAMKMENTLYAPRAGRIIEIAVGVGDTVLRDALLVRLD